MTTCAAPRALALRKPLPKPGDAFPLPEEWTEPDHTSAPARHEWLTARLMELQAFMRVVNELYGKSHPVRREWLDRIDMVVRLCMRAKRDVKQWRRAQQPTPEQVAQSRAQKGERQFAARVARLRANNRTEAA